MIDRLLTIASIPFGVGYSLRKPGPPAEWRDHLLVRMQRLIEYAYQHAEFYRSRWDQAGIHPQNIRSLEDVARLPIIPRAVWRDAEHQAIIPVGRWLSWHNTGGTSNGTSLRVAYTVADDVKIRGMIVGNVMTRSRWLRESLLRFQPPDLQKPGGTSYFRRIYNVASQASIDQRLEALADHPGPLISYPMPLWRTVVEAYRREIPLPPRQYVQVGGEVMTDSVRRVLVRQLGVSVTQGYAATDSGAMAAECQEHHLHIVPEKTFVEVMDGETPAQPGQWGEVVVTNFFSHGRPLVRVRTGDRAMWGENACPCGSPLPYLRYVAGRLEDRIIKPDGASILWPDVEHALHPYAEQVFGYQMEQVDRQRIIARLSVQSAPESPSPFKTLLDDLFEGMTIDIHFTDDIRQAPNGKTRPIIGLPIADSVPPQGGHDPS